MKHSLRFALSLAFLTTAVGCTETDGTGDGGVLDGGSDATGGTTAGDSGGGSGGSGGGDGPVLSLCGVAEAEPNNTREQATPYTANASVVGCIGNGEDLDFYEVTAPVGDASGGYFKAGLTNVGAKGQLDVKVYTASDNSLILTNAYTLDQGANLPFYWAGAPGQKYRVVVSTFSGFSDPFVYTLTAAYTKVNDTYEPNDTREQAKPLVLATPINGYFYAGFKNKEILDPEYDDWFSVTLAAGTATLKVDNVATDVRPQVRLLDPTGAMVDVAGSYNNTPGGSINGTATITTPGEYRVILNIFTVNPEAANKLPDVPDSFTRPYTLTVTNTP